MRYGIGRVRFSEPLRKEKDRDRDKDVERVSNMNVVGTPKASRSDGGLSVLRYTGIRKGCFLRNSRTVLSSSCMTAKKATFSFF